MELRGLEPLTPTLPVSGSLEYFLAVSDAGSFTRAAAILAVAQPSLSAQVRALEDELGGQLFERLARGVKLTAAGRAFEPEARTAVLTAARARRQRSPPST